jgi:hypothetical protein
MTNSQAWKVFFSSLGATVTPEGSHVVVTGIPLGRFRVIHADYPPTVEVRRAAVGLSDATRDLVVILFGMPHLPATRVEQYTAGNILTEDVEVDTDGTALVVPDPLSRVRDEAGQMTLDDKLYCLHEDALGAVFFWPICIEDLPMRPVEYVVAVHSPSMFGRLIGSVYEGRGLTRNGPRLVEALKAVSQRSSECRL